MFTKRARIGAACHLGLPALGRWRYYQGSISPALRTSTLKCGVIWLEVFVKENESLERALRRFKRKVQRSGLYSELRKRRFYEKPSAQRKRQREAAIRRERRRQRRSTTRR